MREQFSKTWVFGAYTSNVVQFEQSFRDIADCVKIAGRQDSQANIFKMVHDLLRNKKYRYMLVLYDPNDSYSLFNRQASGGG